MRPHAQRTGVRPRTLNASRSVRSGSVAGDAPVDRRHYTVRVGRPAGAFFLHLARDGLLFFTRCPDPRLANRNAKERGERGSFFRLPPGLLQLSLSVGVAASVEGTSVDPAGAETILDFSGRLDWSLPERGDFVWYSWARG